MENTTTAPVNPEMELPLLKKKVTDKVKSCYTWACLAVLIQFGLGSAIVGVIQMIVSVVNDFLYHNTLTASEILAMNQDFTTTYQMPLTAAGYIIANFCAAYYACKETKIGSMKKWLNKPKLKAFDVVLACFAVIGIANVVVTILDFCGTAFTNTTENLDATFNSGLFSDNIFITVVTILYMAIVGPILEELLCRGAILNISSVVSRRFAYVVSALMFGFMHGNLIQGINATIMGLILAYFAEKSGSLIVPMILHIANNSFSVIMSYVFEKAIPEANVDKINLIIVCIIGVIGIACAIVLIKKLGKPSEDDGMEINEVVSKEDIARINPKKGELTYKLLFTRLAFWGTVLLFALLSVITINM